VNAFSSLVVDETNESSFPSLHVKLNTGMNRMGIDIDELPQMLVILSNTRAHPHFQSVYSHLAASDDPEQDHFTTEQARLFLTGTRILEDGLGYPVLKHLCNTFGIMRHPHLHFDMVHLGAGIFGGGCFPPLFNLLPALSLRTTTISQVRRMKQGQTMGYNRRGIATRDCRIGVLRIGYADGMRRRMGNGQAQVWVGNRRVPIVRGSVCISGGKAISDLVI
jgi:Alr-MurF fusion protein